MKRENQFLFEKILIGVSFGALNINVALQINNKILFEDPFGDALTTNVQQGYLDDY